MPALKQGTPVMQNPLFAYANENMRIVAGAVIGLICVGLVVLASRAGALADAVVAWWMRTVLASGLTQELLTFGYLITMAGVLLVQGYAHAARTREALTRRLPKSAPKPAVDSRVKYRLLITAAAAVTLEWVLQFTVKDARSGTTTFLPYFVLLINASILPWLFMGAFLVAMRPISGEYRTANAVRFIALAPTVTFVIMGFTVVNLGMLVGLAVLAWVLYPLEKNTLPKSYPTSFEF